MNTRNTDDALLVSVSRSFYLTIRALPRDLRGPIGLAYLLARATDTITDSSGASTETRLRQLGALRRMIETGADHAGLKLLQSEIAPPDVAERELISRLGALLDRLAAASLSDRSDIVDLLRKITRGQELDLMRFGGGEGIAELKTPEELDEYTYLVAGCVGEFWTRLCFRHLRSFSKLSEIEMRALGVNFGKGLQLVNILRDLPSDLAAGRCYLPLAAFGLDAASIRQTPQLGRAVFESWLTQAATHLDAGYRYIESISNFRLRYACILPWHLGMRTLILLREKPPLETSERVKVSRAEVRRVLGRTVFRALSNGLLRAERGRLMRALVAH